METVLKDVDRWQKKKAGFEGEKIVCILFVVPISHDEQEVQMAFGLQVSRALAKQLKLPIHTEWVLTSQKHIDSIKKSIDDTSTAKKEFQEPPTEAVSSSSTNDQELQKEKVSSTANTTDNKSTTESEGSHGATVLTR
ncbi:hypothetical protein EMCRGX_G031875 [Ephydatia muelleri]